MKVETKEVYIAWDGKEFLDKEECAAYEKDNLNPVVETLLYTHGDKESTYYKAKELGMSDEAAGVFRYALYEVEFEVQVNRKTGESYCTHVFGYALEKPAKLT